MQAMKEIQCSNGYTNKNDRIYNSSITRTVLCSTYLIQGPWILISDEPIIRRRTSISSTEQLCTRDTRYAVSEHLESNNQIKNEETIKSKRLTKRRKH